MLDKDPIVGVPETTGKGRQTYNNRVPILGNASPMTAASSNGESDPRE